MPPILQLGFADDRFGSKASGFSKFYSLGIPFPKGIVLSNKYVNEIMSTKRPNELMCFLSELFDDECLLAVRSSAIGEDGVECSYAGVFKSVLGVKKQFNALCTAMELVLDSAKSPTVLLYGDKQSAIMHIIIQEMVQRPLLSGVAFTQVLDEYGSDVLLLEAVEGFGDSLLSGKAKPVKIVVPKNGDTLMFDNIRCYGDIIGIEKMTGIKELLMYIQKIICSGNEKYDIEWSIDSCGKPLFLQIRAITEKISLRHGYAGRGTVAVPGCVRGKAYVIQDATDQLFQQIEEFPNKAIFVSAQIDTQYYPAMLKSSGILTDDSSLLCHAVVVARELGIPCVIGCGQICEQVKTGDDVIIDSYNGLIYVNDKKFSCYDKNRVDWADVYDFDKIRTLIVEETEVLLQETLEGAVLYVSSTLEQKKVIAIECALKNFLRVPIRVYAKEKYDWYYEYQRFQKMKCFQIILERGKANIKSNDAGMLECFYNEVYALMSIIVEERDMQTNLDRVMFYDEFLVSLYFMLNMLLPLGYGFLEVYYNSISVLNNEGISFVDFAAQPFSVEHPLYKMQAFYTALIKLRDNVAERAIKMKAYRFSYFDDRITRVAKALDLSLDPHASMIDKFYEHISKYESMSPALNKLLLTNCD